MSNEESSERAHHQSNSINSHLRLRILAPTASSYSGKLESLWYHDSRKRSVLCHHVGAESSIIPSARLGHTIVAWANVSSNCIGQNKRAVQRIRREVGADRGEGPRPSVHDLESAGMLTTSNLTRESESSSNNRSPNTVSKLIIHEYCSTSGRLSSPIPPRRAIS